MPSKAVLGHSWTYSALFGRLGALLDVQGVSWGFRGAVSEAILGRLGATWAAFEAVEDVLASLLACLGRLRSHFQHVHALDSGVGLPWAVFGLYWSSLVPF